MSLSGNPILSHTVAVKSPAVDSDGEVFRDPVTGQPESQDGDAAINFTVSTAEAPCRVDSATGRQIQNERMRDGTEVTHLMFCEPELVITEEDVVTVTDIDGVIIVDDADVVRVGRPSGYDGRTYHRQVLLRAVKDTGP